MDLFHELILGFGVAIQPVNLFYCFLGCLIGTLVGVLPGLGRRRPCRCCCRLRFIFRR